MTADLDIHVAVRDQVLLLPVEALLDRKGSNATVRLADSGKKGGKAGKREIRLGLSSDSEVEVLSGLDEGTEVRIAPPAVDNALKM